MTLLQYDPSGALDARTGLTPAQWAEGLAHADSLRQACLQAAAAESPWSFLDLPRQQLEAYEQHREDSELGRVFSLANGMHDRLDAVVVLGVGGSSLGAQALLQACCHPYHNELSRGGRGSKPRMYFAGDSLDNDATAALLDRLAAAGTEDNPVCDCWGLCVVSQSGERLETGVAFRQFLAALQRSRARDPGSLSKFVFPVTGPRGRLRSWVQRLGCDPILNVPDQLCSRYSVLCPSGLLPAAFLGLDCIQLLLGAMAISDHFRTAPAEENIVLQFAAANHLLHRHRGCSLRVSSVWSQSLAGLGRWYEQVLGESTGGAAAPLPITMVNPGDWHSRDPRRRSDTQNTLVNNLLLARYRTDPLAVDACRSDHGGLNFLTGKSLPELNRAASDRSIRLWQQAGFPTTTLTLPSLDTHALGQLFQLLMIASAVEAVWLGRDPFAPSAAAADLAAAYQTLPPQT
ncbi:glucose-6-phosphate isomerase [Roseimaritima sediminicola]|uniref:glucose-6-phosphate isomerase n=1 Tax=Roseimaritima sediminicola TaxID=2662066 RepID=UPI001298278F|nr:glucose-6-phosphate isomerase [Roseimaritima sediminicola]